MTTTVSRNKVQSPMFLCEIRVCNRIAELQNYKTIDVDRRRAKQIIVLIFSSVLGGILKNNDVTMRWSEKEDLPGARRAARNEGVGDLNFNQYIS